MHTVKVFLTIISLFFPLHSYSWERKSNNFDPSVYGGGTQNWQIKESKEGWLYYANNNGLLEFDGYNWTLYPMNNKIVRAIELGEDTIFAGGNNIFGYYTKNKNGVLMFTSLSNKVDKNWKGNVWSIYAIGNKIYYIDDHNIYVFSKNFNYERTIKCKFKIDCTLRSENNVYIGGNDELSLFDTAKGEVRSTQYKNLSNHTQKTGFKIVELLPHNEQLIIVTANSGIFITDGDKDVRKLSTAGDAFIAQNQIFQASMINNLLAIGSVQNGLLLLDLKRPDFFEVINQDNTLNNNTVLSTFFDRNQNLWIGLDNGISFINMDGAINPLFSKESPIGTGYCSQNYNGRLYLGTNQGLYTLDKGSILTPIFEAKGQIITLTNIHNTLFSCGDNNLFVIDGNQRYSINMSGFMGVFPIENRSDILIATTYFGLKLLEKKNGKWGVAHDIKGLNVACKSGLTHFRNNEFWQANPDDDFVNKLIFDSEFNTVKVKRYYLRDNKVVNNSFINVVDFNPVVCTNKGLFKYVLDIDNFVPYKELENLLDGDKTYEYLFVDTNRDIWYKVDGSLYFLPYSNNRVDLLKYYVGFESQLVDGEESISILDSSRVVIGTYKGFSLVNKSIIQNKDNSLDINIRWIKTVKDGITTSYTKANNTLVLPYGSNVISFAWGGHNLSSEGEVYFSYRLLGLDAEWSVPMLNHVKEYTNLKEGKYTFEVRTFIKGINDEQLSYDKISFEIQPPWFRSIWAYCVYSILIVCVFIFLYQYIVMRQNKEIRKKQRKIEYQQLLLKEEARVKDEKILQLEKDKLETDLQYKTQETTGYILNISRKNEMFDRIKTEASALLKLIDTKGSIPILRKRISDLIQDVNNNVKHDADFESFKSNFDIVHKDFFKILENKYPQLTQKDKTLCAYIKMNFVSKEIAPLLNISVRGVEINRYNLRKKMELDRNINLSEYLNNLT